MKYLFLLYFWSGSLATASPGLVAILYDASPAKELAPVNSFNDPKSCEKNLVRARDTKLNSLNGMSIGTFVGLTSAYVGIAKTIHKLEKLEEDLKKREQAFRTISKQSKKRSLQIHELRNSSYVLDLRESDTELKALLKQLDLLKFKNPEFSHLGIPIEKIESFQIEINRTLASLKLKILELRNPNTRHRNFTFPPGVTQSLSDLRRHLYAQSNHFSQIASRIKFRSKIAQRAKVLTKSVKLMGTGLVLSLYELFAYAEPNGSTLSGWRLKDEFLLNNNVPAAEICNFIMTRGGPNEISYMRYTFAQLWGLQKAENRWQGGGLLRVSQSPNANSVK